MIKFIYNFVKRNEPVSEYSIIRTVLKEYDWLEYSRWQMRVTIIEKLKFLTDIGILYSNTKRRKVRNKNEFVITKYYRMGKYDIGECPKFKLNCKLGALFYGGGMGEGFLYPLFRFEQISIDKYDDTDDNEYVIYVYYDGRDAKECYRYLVEKSKEELCKLYKKVIL